VQVADDAIQTHDFTGHLKPRDLFAAIFQGDAGFEKTRANGIQGSEAGAMVVEGIAAFDFAPSTHQIIDAVQVGGAQIDGHAQLAQIAVGAGNFKTLWIHGGLQTLLDGGEQQKFDLAQTRMLVKRAQYAL
jgi:hypothetical protein